MRTFSRKEYIYIKGGVKQAIKESTHKFDALKYNWVYKIVRSVHEVVKSGHYCPESVLVNETEGANNWSKK